MTMETAAGESFRCRANSRMVTGCIWAVADLVGFLDFAGVFILFHTF